MNRYALEMRARERHRDILRASPSRLPFTVTRSLLRTYLSRSLSRRDDCQLEALVIEWARLLRANDPVEWELPRANLVTLVPWTPSSRRVERPSTTPRGW
jgi:hypothetical protein